MAADRACPTAPPASSLHPPPPTTLPRPTLPSVLTYIPITFIITEFRGKVRKHMNRLDNEKEGKATDMLVRGWWWAGGGLAGGQAVQAGARVCWAPQPSLARPAMPLPLACPSPPCNARHPNCTTPQLNYETVKLFSAEGRELRGYGAAIDAFQAQEYLQLVGARLAGGWAREGAWC